MSLLSIFRKNNVPKTGYVVKEAFTIKGRVFFEMDDQFNLPYERGVICLRYYNEFNQRVTREYLHEHVKAVDEILTFHPGKSIDLLKLALLNRNLKDRMQWIVDEDLAYKLASVVFFDKNENPATYDTKYNQEKISFWKKEASAKEFFFSEPLRRLIPFLKDLEPNLETYFEVTRALSSQHQKDISSIL
ncbi:hypothetical protein [Chitinophaga nivalis]|uniref:Uncharacterized protein n=1 Tax=Chitinophaga nivalis TaxID=2991709 RepID=A0ABT3IIJ9_9BACT|nr:hypothetical protein [Chitinophaga nivalis]MCW3466509.1 hypothetical protein [Chitinophaga nivalis]MCW3483800.1 hypothetical protein [Chitinophaga nivalis]